jgi:hypothetical protein
MTFWQGRTGLTYRNKTMRQVADEIIRANEAFLSVVGKNPP